MTTHKELADYVLAQDERTKMIVLVSAPNGIAVVHTVEDSMEMRRDLMKFAEVLKP